MIEIFLGLLTFISGLLGWFAKTLWNAVQELKDDLSRLREELPKTYLQKDDFSEFRHELLTKVDKILDRLERKQDKENGT